MRKTILITGASSGIGKATAKLFQQKEWNVIATMRSPEKETELINLENMLVTKLDVQNVETIESAVRKGIVRFGKIDVVVNNAGYGLVGTFESASRESIKREFGVNVFGLFDVTRAVLPHFRARKSGLFINISSAAGKTAYPISSLYHSSKFAVEGFSESLYYELAAIGIGVKIIEPGAVATDFTGRSLDFQHNESLTEYNPFVEETMQAFQKLTNPGTMSTSEMIAAVIFNAATDGTKQLRYIAGVDAEHLLEARRIMTDDEFIAKIKSSLGLQDKITQ